MFVSHKFLNNRHLATDFCCRERNGSGADWGGGGEDGYSNCNQLLWGTLCPSRLLQVPWGSPIGIGQRLASSGTQPTEGTTGVGATVQDVGKGGCGFPDLGKNIPGGDPGGPYAWVLDAGDETVHWEGFWWIPPQFDP